MKIITWYCGSCGNEFEAGETESTKCPECGDTLTLGYKI